MSSANSVRTPAATFVVVANRLPVDRVENPDGSVDWRPSPAAWSRRSSRSCAAIAAPGLAGSPDEELEPFANDGLQLIPVAQSATEVEQYYEGFPTRPFGRSTTT